MARKHTCILIALTLALASPLAASSHSESAAHDAVQKAVDGFYAALNALFTGDLEPMDAVWSHADDVTYLGPGGGIKVGWAAVSKDWEAQAAMKLGGKVEAKDVHITVGSGLAVVVGYEVGENKGEDGKTTKVEIRATSTFRQEGGAWKMIGHHADLLGHIP